MSGSSNHSIAPYRIRGGRPSSDVWDHISREKLADGKIMQTCNYCGAVRKSMQSLASQWAMHLVERCEAVDVEVSVEIYEAKRDSIKGVKEAGERRGLHLQDPSKVTPAIPNTRAKTARNAVMKAEELALTTMPLPSKSPQRVTKRPAQDDANPSSRPSISVWDHVSKAPPVDGAILQTCNHCGYTKKAAQLLASNWAVHLVEQCQAVDLEISYQIWQLKKDSVRAVCDAGVRRGFVENVPPEAIKLEPPQHKTAHPKAAIAGPRASLEAGNTTSNNKFTPVMQKKQRTSLYDAGDQCDQARADKITLAIMEFLAGCAIPMMVVESSFFINLLMAMNETYTKKFLPKADVFTRTWLPKLHESVDQKLDAHWRADRDSYLSLGSDVFRDEEGQKVLIVTEAKLDKVAFRDWVVEGDERQTGAAIAQMWMDRMIATAGGDPDNVESRFGAVCADFTRISPTAGRTIEEKYPKIFFNGCRSRCGDLLCEDIASISQVEMLVKNVKTIINFVRSHDPVKAAYTRLMKRFEGSRLLSFSDTRFAHIDRIFASLLGPEEQNIEVLNALVTDPEWDTIVAGISPWNVAEFVALIHDAEFFNRVKCIRGITQPLSIFIHHLDRAGARVSWLLPAFEALEKDLFVWCDDTTTGEYFLEETVTGIKKAFDRRWKGTDGGGNRDNNYMGLYAPQHLLSMILDPTTTMNVEELNQVHPLWYPECRKVLMRFYGESDLIIAKTQLYELVNQTGNWGDEVAESQTYVSVEAEQHRFKVQTIVAKQLKSIDLKPHLLWKVAIGGQFPKLKDIAMRLLTMSTQSADVERVCQVEKFVNSKVCDRLKNDNVKKLIYCYVNLRLLKTIGVERDDGNVVEDFLCDAILEEDVSEEEDIDGTDEQEVMVEDRTCLE